MAFFDNLFDEAKFHGTLITDDVGFGYVIKPAHSLLNENNHHALTLYQNKFWAEYLLRNHSTFWGYRFNVLELYQQLYRNPLQHHRSEDEIIDELSNRMAAGELLVYKVHNFIPPPPDQGNADIPMASAKPAAPNKAYNKNKKKLQPGGRSNSEVNASQTHSASDNLSENNVQGINHSNREISEHWIEIIIRDEFNCPFNNVKGKLIDSSGKQHDVELSRQPILLKGIAPGSVSLELESTSWLKETQKPERKPNKETEPVKKFADSYTGYKANQPNYFTVTTGDLTKLPDNITLPENHQAKQADNFDLTAGQSYILKVKGFNYRVLRIGVFFDGTGNNTDNHQQGLPELESWLRETCDTPEQAAEEFENCRLGSLPVEGSYANDITNIGKLNQLYNNSITQERHIIETYIDGIGTIKGDSDNVIGSAISLGNTSVIARVEQACCNVIAHQIAKQVSTRERLLIDGYSRIEFDVFGFSRGAAAARHFVNTIDQKSDHGLVQSLLEIDGLKLKAGFDWTSRDDSRITFVGIFDTVESAWQDTHLGLYPDCADRVVHLTAADEYRTNFPLTRITNHADGTGIANNSTEIILPGAHSDVGGGYYSRHTLSSNTNADPVLTEHIQLRYFVSLEANLAQPDTESRAYRAALDYARYKLNEGWADKIVTITSPDSQLNDGEIGLRIKTFYRGKERRKKSVHIEVLMHRIVEGELSRLPLRMMVEAGKNENVPFIKWKTNNKALTTQTIRSDIPFRLSGLESKWLHHAYTKGAVIDLSTQLSKPEYRRLRRYYCHHSYHENNVIDKLVNKANYSFWDSGEIASRELLPNTPGKTS